MSNEIQEKVNEVVAKAEKNDKGDLILSDEALEGLDPALSYAVKTELRYRNTQSNYTKATQEKAKLEKTAEKLTEKLAKNLTVKLTKDQQTELDQLKKNDVEKYRTRRNEMEQEAKDTLVQELNTIEQESENLSEVEVRKLKLEAFNEASGIELTQQMIDDHLPPLYLKELENGKVTFDEFLVNAQNYLTKNKVIKGSNEEDPDKEPDMNKMAGGGEPSRSSTEGDIVETYKSTIF